MQMSAVLVQRHGCGGLRLLLRVEG